jgi:hypothetical protein
MLMINILQRRSLGGGKSGFPLQFSREVILSHKKTTVAVCFFVIVEKYTTLHACITSFIGI